MRNTPALWYSFWRDANSGDVSRRCSGVIGVSKRDEARDLLAPVYGWFTEGFETVDLKQAKAVQSVEVDAGITAPGTFRSLNQRFSRSVSTQPRPVADMSGSGRCRAT
jgi:hypothetical protein